MAQDTTNSKLPIVYSTYYDLKCFGLEKWHAFDAGKWGRIINFLIEKLPKRITKERISTPTEATMNELLIGHTPRYLDTLRWSSNIARILEVFFLKAIPCYLLDKYVLRAFRYQVNGTVMAAKMALDKTWAINIGGGFHHASADSGGGFCVYADISIAIKTLMKEHEDFKFLIIDLDAHQGNGHETDFANESKVFIMDMYNQVIYPNDKEAKKGINVDDPLISWTTDKEYMAKLQKNLDKSFQQVSPQLIVYNAGTDCLEGDPLGRLDITANGIKERDELVFRTAKEKGVPIVMVTSGGYQKSNAEIIADSIVNLFEKGIIE